ncbi:MAG: PD-(D/E)XK nuclease family transposase, partial [Peptostreptococcaceae bacterium]|nr:PD-(D/E)XK nuclease family transposase [Peptostreptococcaceae bacterium]
MSYERYKAIIKELILLDDILMRKVFESTECTRLLIRIILGQEDLEIESLRIQPDYKNLQGRSLIMDIVAQDEQGNQYNIEVQRDRYGASPKRARYHSGLLDMNTSRPSSDLDELPKNYVIFITENDVLGYGYQLYHIERVIRENGESFPDESYILYLNTEKEDGSALGKLIHDLRCKDPDKMYYREFRERTGYFKHEEKGEMSMCEAMRDLIQEERMEGMIEGQIRGMKE